MESAYTEQLQAGQKLSTEALRMSQANQQDSCWMHHTPGLFRLAITCAHAHLRCRLTLFSSSSVENTHHCILTPTGYDPFCSPTEQEVFTFYRVISHFIGFITLNKRFLRLHIHDKSGPLVGAQQLTAYLMERDDSKSTAAEFTAWSE